MGHQTYIRPPFHIQVLQVLVTLWWSRKHISYLSILHQNRTHTTRLTHTHTLSQRQRTARKRMPIHSHASYQVAQISLWLNFYACTATSWTQTNLYTHTQNTVPTSCELLYGTPCARRTERSSTSSVKINIHKYTCAKHPHFCTNDILLLYRHSPISATSRQFMSARAIRGADVWPRCVCVCVCVCARVCEYSIQSKFQITISWLQRRTAHDGALRRGKPEWV